MRKGWKRVSNSHCQKSKVQRHTSMPFSTFATPGARFSNIHIDIVGPLPLSKGYTYILICIDRFTCWLEGFQILDMSVETVAQVFLSGWIARFDILLQLRTTDRGCQFVNQSLLKLQFMQLLGCKCIHNTSYCQWIKHFN